jgi:hypothetical protein
MNPFLKGVTDLELSVILSNYSRTRRTETIANNLGRTYQDVKEIAFGLGLSQKPTEWTRIKMRKLGIRRCSLCRCFKPVKEFKSLSFCEKCRHKYYKEVYRNNSSKKFFYERLKGLKRHARVLGVKFRVNKKWFKKWWNEKDYCYYCGSSLFKYLLIQQAILRYSGKNKSIIRFKNLHGLKYVKTFTVDRKKSHKGYYPANMVKCCNICNIVKGKYLSAADMKKIAPAFIRRITRLIFI